MKVTEKQIFEAIKILQERVDNLSSEEEEDLYRIAIWALKQRIFEYTNRETIEQDGLCLYTNSCPLCNSPVVIFEEGYCPHCGKRLKERKRYVRNG